MKTYRVTVAQLNIRSGPGKDYEDLGDLTQGQEILVPDMAGWLPIVLEDNFIGWVAQEFVEEVGEAEEEVEPAPAPGFATKEEVIEAIKAECGKQGGLPLATQIAYVIATTEWETGRTFKPVREAYWKDEAWRKAHLNRYWPYYGRGYVQLTWKDNYRKYSVITGKDLVGNPDLAMEPETALFILVHGFKTGAFTGKKLEDYVNEAETDFFNARRCINALDKAQEIADLADKYLETLEA